LIILQQTQFIVKNSKDWQGTYKMYVTANSRNLIKQGLST